MFDDAQILTAEPNMIGDECRREAQKRDDDEVPHTHKLKAREEMELCGEYREQAITEP